MRIQDEENCQQPTLKTDLIKQYYPHCFVYPVHILPCWTTGCCVDLSACGSHISGTTSSYLLHTRHVRCPGPKEVQCWIWTDNMFDRNKLWQNRRDSSCLQLAVRDESTFPELWILSVKQRWLGSRVLLNCTLQFQKEGGIQHYHRPSKQPIPKSL